MKFVIDLPLGLAHLYPAFHAEKPDSLAPYYIYMEKAPRDA